MGNHGQMFDAPHWYGKVDNSDLKILWRKNTLTSIFFIFVLLDVEPRAPAP